MKYHQLAGAAAEGRTVTNLFVAGVQITQHQFDGIEFSPVHRGAAVLLKISTALKTLASVQSSINAAMAAWRASSAAACTALGLLLSGWPMAAELNPRRLLNSVGRPTSNPPWKVDFTNYNWYVNQAQGQYYFTVTLAENAGAGLGGLMITQTRGVDRTFSLAPQRARGILGRPRRKEPLFRWRPPLTRRPAPAGGLPRAAATGSGGHAGLRPPLIPQADTYLCRAGTAGRAESGAGPLGRGRLEIMSRFGDPSSPAGGGNTTAIAR